MLFMQNTNCIMIFNICLPHPRISIVQFFQCRCTGYYHTFSRVAHERSENIFKSFKHTLPKFVLNALHLKHNILSNHEVNIYVINNENLVK